MKGNIPKDPLCGKREKGIKTPGWIGPVTFQRVIEKKRGKGEGGKKDLLKAP